MTKRSDQNPARTLIRKIYDLNFETYKIHKIGVITENKPRLLAICDVLREDNNLHQTQLTLQLDYRYLFEHSSPLSKKDKKLKSNVNFIISLKDEDFSKENIKKTLQRIGHAGQDKKHPLDAEKYSIDNYYKDKEKERRFLKF